MKFNSSLEIQKRTTDGSGTVENGFSMLELLVAMVIFVIIGGTAFTLFMRQQPFANQQLNQVGLGIGLRNAMTQLQNDLVNAGSGQLTGANIPSSPVGVAIVNNVPTTSCYNSTTNTYSASCFDSISIVAANLSVPPIHADGAGACTTTNSATSTADAATGFTAAQTAAKYSSGDQLLFLKSNGSGLGPALQFTTVVLTGTPTVSGGLVQFPHNATGANGSNTAANDPLGITTDGSDANNMLGNQFCTTDWIVKLAPITYQVDTSNSADPKLTRTQYGTTATVMEQVIGFKVGATIWNNSTDVLSTQYIYDASTYVNGAVNEAYNFTLVRSIRVSLIGRTTPSTDPSYTFRNTFDNGAYQIQSLAIVVNPRNMSMRD